MSLYNCDHCGERWATHGTTCRTTDQGSFAASTGSEKRVAGGWKEIDARIQNYLGNGGLFNPEYMEHDKVRDLLMDIRNEIAAGGLLASQN